MSSSDNNVNEKKNIEVVTGNGNNLAISSVSTHVPATKPKINRNPKDKIVIPQEKKKK